ncbi:MAG: transcription elongation factor GreA [Synergistaceae bacterium]|nr:transcription elongation factor GreA [Synergistaceae bacterium]
MSKKDENQVELTRGGYESLSEELKHLKTARRQEVAKQLEEARAFGDLSENAEYAAAKDEQAKVEGRISELEVILGSAKIKKNLDTSVVAIGLTVALEDLDNTGKTYTYTLVGSEELSSGGSTEAGIQRISQRSPVGQAVVGHRVGDEVVARIPKGLRHLKITDIRDPDGNRSVPVAPVGQETDKDGKPENGTKVKAKPKSKAKPKTEAKEAGAETESESEAKPKPKPRAKAKPKAKKQEAEA